MGYTFIDQTSFMNMQNVEKYLNVSIYAETFEPSSRSLVQEGLEIHQCSDQDYQIFGELPDEESTGITLIEKCLEDP